MTRAEWSRTLLGAVAAMGWLAGPVPLPPQFRTLPPLHPANHEWAPTRR